MSFNFLVAPDFPPRYFAGWHFLNTYLQRELDMAVHLLTPADALEEKADIEADKVDLIYANPFDAAHLVRKLGYLPVARPINQSDEMVIVSAKDSAINVLADIKPGMKVLFTDNIDVKLVGLRLLEAVDIDENSLEWLPADTFQSAARRLIQGEADISFFMAGAYHALSKLTRDRMNLLIESRIYDLSHIVLVHKRVAERQKDLQQAFAGIKDNAAGQRLLGDLGMPDGFEVLEQEDVEFLIDLIETLRD